MNDSNKTEKAGGDKPPMYREVGFDAVGLNDLLSNMEEI